MSVAEVIEAVLAVAALVVAVWGTYYAKKANKMSDDANKAANDANGLSKEANKVANEANVIAGTANSLAEKALEDSEKDYMPYIKFVGNVTCKDKSAVELGKEVTFDICNQIVFSEEAATVMLDFANEEEYASLTFKMQNVGKGIVTGVKIKSLLIYAGYYKELWKVLERYNDCMGGLIFYKDNLECSQDIILCENEQTDINILIPANEINTDYSDNLSETIEKDDVLVIAELDIFSTNGTVYKERALWGNFENGTAKRSAFVDVEKLEEVKKYLEGTK